MDTWIEHFDLGLSEKTPTLTLLNDYTTCAELLITQLQEFASQLILPHPPPIVWVDAPPKRDREWDWDTEQLPGTDVLGAYFTGSIQDTGCHVDPATISGRRIELYPDMIGKAAWCLHRDMSRHEQRPLYISTLACFPDMRHLRDYSKNELEKALESIVLIHEIHHAIMHMGNPSGKVQGGNAALVWLRELVDFQGAPQTPQKISMLLSERMTLWKSIPSRLLEQQAQLATWHTVKSHWIGGVFVALMAGQPDDYVLDAKMMSSPVEKLWLWMCLLRMEWFKSHGYRVDTEDTMKMCLYEQFLIRDIDAEWCI